MSVNKEPSASPEQPRPAGLSPRTQEMWRTALKYRRFADDLAQGLQAGQ
jgi:hypothetical protein